MSANSSGWLHTGTGDFINKIVSGSGASGSNCFAVKNVRELLLHPMMFNSLANQTYEFKAYVKTINREYHVTLRINVGGVDVATSGNNIC